jgi:hypothetical protein
MSFLKKIIILQLPIALLAKGFAKVCLIYLLNVKYADQATRKLIIGLTVRIFQEHNWNTKYMKILYD